MAISREEYMRILADQDAGRLTVMFSTSGFRKLLVEEVDPTKLAATLGHPVEGPIRRIRELTNLDATAPFVASVLSVLAFGWWGLLGVIGSFVGWAAYKMRASIGRQRMSPVLIGLVMFLVAAFILPLPNWWGRGFVISLGVMFFLDRALYVITAYIVSGFIQASYEFFNMFYLQQPPSAVVPLIWTTETQRTTQMINGGTPDPFRLRKKGR